MRCDDAQPQINALVDGELNAWAAARVRRHLQTCPACREDYNAIQRLTEQARAWRTVTPPVELGARLNDLLSTPPLEDNIMSSAAVFPRPVTRRQALRRQAFAALGAAGAVLIAALLLFPDSPGRPTVAYADVQRAMLQVKIVHCTESFTERSQNGAIKNQGSTQVWIRRSPPAVMQRIHYVRTSQRDYNSLMLRDTRGLIRYEPANRTYYIDDARREPNMRESVLDVEKLIQGQTDPGNGSWPEPSAPAQAFATTRGRSVINGKAALQFIYRTSQYTKTVWADSRTLRIIRMELVPTTPSGSTGFRNNVECLWRDFEYDQPPAPGTFDWSPPHGAKVVTF